MHILSWKQVFNSLNNEFSREQKLPTYSLQTLKNLQNQTGKFFFACYIQMTNSQSLYINLQNQMNHFFFTSSFYMLIVYFDHLNMPDGSTNDKSGDWICAKLENAMTMFQGGMYIFQILDWYAAAFSVMVIAMLECLVCAWVYGECCIIGTPYIFKLLRIYNLVVTSCLKMLFLKYVHVYGYLWANLQWNQTLI